MKFATFCISIAALALALPGFSADHTGKAAFDKTCKNCHGPEGKGDRAADKFYQVQIPRLNSAYVQNKPDKELKEIITSGKRKMKPVRPGQPTMSHEFQAEWVDDVIAYVRTLKKI